MNDSRYKRIILNTPSKKLGYKLTANEIDNNVKYNYITFLNAKLSNIFHYSILIFGRIILGLSVTFAVHMQTDIENLISKINICLHIYY